MKKLIVIIILLISNFCYYGGGNENGQKAVNIEKQEQKENAIKNDNEEKTEINTFGKIDDVIEKKEKENSIKKISEEKQISEQSKKEKQTEIKRNTQESENKITNTTKSEVQTKNTITAKTEETKERPKCTHTSENYYNSKTEAEAIYNAEIKKWGDKWTSNEIDIEEYSKKCPDGYEVWSCQYCNKWTIEMYY